MTEPSDSNVPREPPEGIDAFDNPDAEGYENNQSSPLARASEGGLPDEDAPRAGEAPHTEGTGAGDPLAGVGLPEDVETVAGDEGPEHSGVRRSS